MFTTKKIFAALLLVPLFVGCTVDDGDEDTGAGTDTDPTDATMTDPTVASMTDPTVASMTDATMTDPTVTDTGTVTATEDTGPSTDTDPSATGDSTAGETEGGGAGFCQQTCAEDLDCCAEGTEEFGCPTDYPFNVTCTDGACEYGGCTSDDDCATIAGTTCHDVSGFPSCVPLCTGDGAKECIKGETCTGMTDDGDTYCVFEFPPCEADADCGTAGVCDLETGLCGCTEDSECGEGFQCSAG